MVKIGLCIILFFSVPAVATIAQQRSAASWGCAGTTNAVTGQITCTANFSTTGANDLIAVWTTWESAYTLTATVADSYPTQNIYVSAVGPTVQPTQASGNGPTSGQIFYAKKIQGGGDTVIVTLTISPAQAVSVPSFGMVIAEYSGLDTVNPLDSVS